MPERDYYVYITTNNSGTLYVGVTNNLERRMAEHKRRETPGFAQRYKAVRLVYFELAPDAQSAIRREKQVKGWLRRRKIDLIASINLYWRDLSETFDPKGETLRFAHGDSEGSA